MSTVMPPPTAPEPIVVAGPAAPGIVEPAPVGSAALVGLAAIVPGPAPVVEPVIVAAVPAATVVSVETVLDDVTGALLERIITYSNCIVSTLTFGTDGNLVQRTVTDLADVKPWASVVSTYAAGNPYDATGRIVTGDDGVVKTFSYSDTFSRAATSLVIEDTLDTKAYASVEREFDLSGTLLQSVHTMDDGRIIIRGDEADNLLRGSDADEIFKAQGGADTFLFDDGSGRDDISGFDVADDKLDLTAYGITRLSDLEGMIEQRGSATKIDLGGGDIIRLRVTDADQLSDANFVTGSAQFDDGVRIGYSYLLPDIDNVVVGKEIVLADGPDTALHPTSPRRLVEIEGDQITITFTQNVPYATFSGGYSGIRISDDYGQLADIVGAEVNQTDSTGILPINPFQPERPVIPDVTYDEDTIWVNFSSVNQGIGTVVIDVDFA